MGETIEKLQRDVAQWKPGTTSQRLGNGAEKVESSVITRNKSREFTDRIWKPGQSGNPNGRPTKARELAILDAITNAFTPEEITTHLREAMKVAKDKDSARGIVAVLEFMADRAVGKPVQRIETDSGGLASILAVIDGRE